MYYIYVSMIKAFFQLIRFQNIAIVGFSMALGALCLANSPGFFQWAIGFASLGLMTAAGNIQNDILDIETDRAEGKNRPLVNGNIPLKTALGFMRGFYTCGFVLAAFLDSARLFLSLIVIAFLYVYNHKLKNSIFWGNFTVALLCAIAVWYFEWPKLPQDSFYPFAFAFLSTLFREIAKDAEDAKGDKATGVQTLANKLGEKKTVNICLALWALLLLLYPFPYFHQDYHFSYLIILALIGGPSFISILQALLKPHVNWTQTQKALKIYMLAGVLALISGSAF